MSIAKKEWLYSDEDTGQAVGPLSRDELDEHFRQGKVHEYTRVANIRMPRTPGPMGEVLNTIPYSTIGRFEIEFSPTVESFRQAREGHATTVLSGANNTGKSLLLKQLMPLLGHSACLLGCNRFSTLDVLNTRQRDQHEKRRSYENFVQSQFSAQQNTESNDRQLEVVIAGLKNYQRSSLFNLAGRLLNCHFELRRVDEENELSPFYIDMNGQNVKYGSSGTRLLLTLLGNLLDSDYSTVLIDEPELGLSPKIQLALANALYSEETRREHFPHLKQIFVVTHSHLFLDKRVLRNNYVVEKDRNTISIRGISSLYDLHQLQFGMLGNELESLFFPSAIIVVEGPSDVVYLSKILSLRIPDRKIAIVVSHGDGESKDKLNTINEVFGDLAASPYRSRLFVVLDKRNSVRKARLEAKGVLSENIQVWAENGIEYYYPKSRIAEAFRCDVADLAGVDLSNDPVAVHGNSLSKRQLAEFIANKVTVSDALPLELEQFLERVGKAAE